MEDAGSTNLEHDVDGEHMLHASHRELCVTLREQRRRTRAEARPERGEDRQSFGEFLCAATQLNV